jgi:transcriptional regulator GlxA family with amidase domain
VIGGNLPVQTKSKKLFSTLRIAHKNLSKIIAVDTGAFIVAESGLINKETIVCTHWETKSNFIERYPDIKIVENIYTINANGLMFAAGGISTLDLILECIKKIKGKNYSDEIAQALIYRPREKSTMQKNDQFNPSIDNICQKSILIMEKNIETPIKINEIAKKLNISLRTLERKFYKLYKMSPIKFYVNLRIKFARNLLFYDDRKINEISSIAGFNYNSVFINSFKKIYNKTPSEYRKYFRNQQFDKDILES